MTINMLERSVRRMPPADRMKIVETILNSLDKPDPEIERAWMTESERRYAAFQKGKLRVISLKTGRERLGR